MVGEVYVRRRGDVGGVEAKTVSRISAWENAGSNQCLKRRICDFELGVKGGAKLVRYAGVTDAGGDVLEKIRLIASDAFPNRACRKAE